MTQNFDFCSTWKIFLYSLFQVIRPLQSLWTTFTFSFKTTPSSDDTLNYDTQILNFNDLFAVVEAYMYIIASLSFQVTLTMSVSVKTNAFFFSPSCFAGDN